MLMEIVVTSVGIVLAVLLGFLAHRKGYSAALWVFAGGIVGLIALAFLPSVADATRPPPLRISSRNKGNRIGAILTGLTIGIGYLFTVGGTTKLFGVTMVGDLGRVWGHLPVFQVCVVGIVAAATGWRRHPQPSALVLTAALIEILRVSLPWRVLAAPGTLLANTRFANVTSSNYAHYAQTWWYATRYLDGILAALALALLFRAALLWRDERSVQEQPAYAQTGE